MYMYMMLTLLYYVINSHYNSCTLFMCVQVCKHVYNMRTCEHSSVCVCCMCMYVCVCSGVHVCVCVCACKHTCVYAYVHMWGVRVCMYFVCAYAYKQFMTGV